MAGTKDDVQGVAELLAKTKVEQVNVVSFKGKSFKLDSEDDGKKISLSLSYPKGAKKISLNNLL